MVETHTEHWINDRLDARHQGGKWSLFAKGEWRSLEEWMYHPDCMAKRKSLLFMRLRKGWTSEEALFKPKHYKRD